MYMHPDYLLALQGVVVPAVLDVHVSAVEMRISLQVPAPCDPVEADPKMPHSLKEQIIQVYEKVHALGILHGAVKMKNILIASDDRIMLLDFSKSRSVRPNGVVGRATPQDLAEEMREIKKDLGYVDGWQSKSQKVPEYNTKRKPDTKQHEGSSHRRSESQVSFTGAESPRVDMVHRAENNGRPRIQYDNHPPKLSAARMAHDVGGIMQADPMAKRLKSGLPTTPRHG